MRSPYESHGTYSSTERPSLAVMPSSNEKSFDRLQLETDYYADFFDHAHMDNQRDGRWLKQLSGITFDDTWLTYIHTHDVGIGSAELDFVDDDLKPAVIAAREDFYENILSLSDEDSPLRTAYTNFKERYPLLEAPATMITVFRRLDEHGINVPEKIAQVPGFLTLCKKLFATTEPEDMPERIRQINTNVDSLLERPIVVKRTHVPSPSRQEPTKKRTSRGRMVVMPSDEIIAERTPHLLELGFTQETIDENTWALTRLSSNDVDSFLKLFANYGVDGIKMMSGHLAGLEKITVAESRLAAMQELGLHVPSVLEGYSDALCIKSEMITEKIPLISNFLQATRSDIPVAKAISERPKMLSRSATKYTALAGILDGSTDTEGMHIRYIEPFARNSLDVTFAALVRRKQDGEMVHASDLDKTARVVPSDERRQHNLDAIRDASIRTLLSTKAIVSYLTAVPLTEKESQDYPDLAEFV